MTPQLTINGTLLLPNIKHKVLFQAFDRLQVGESFIFKNDHDPKSLYHLLMSQRGARFEWKYMESGPKLWYVCIKRTK